MNINLKNSDEMLQFAYNENNTEVGRIPIRKQDIPGRTRRQTPSRILNCKSLADWQEQTE